MNRVGLVTILCWLTVALCPDEGRCAEVEDQTTEVGDRTTEVEGRTGSGVVETVTVIANRLPDESELRDVPTHVTVISRERIESSGATTLQDLLVREAGVLLHDQVGNGYQTTLDLRGLGGGTGVRVFLDGAPINDPRNNSLSLELIPLTSLERIEIIRGSAASLAGGGAQAGTVHLVSRRGAESLTGTLTLSGGSFDTQRAAGELRGGGEQLDFFVSAEHGDTDGFRDNADGDTTRVAATLGLGLGGDRRLELSVLGSRVDLGNPGALTPAELATDRDRAPFNSLDFTDESAGQLALNYRDQLVGPWSVAANLFYRDRSTESLTTGRAAPSFGGFFLDVEQDTVGSTVQVSRAGGGAADRSRLTLGLEWLSSDTDAAGFATLPTNLGGVDPANLSSDNATERRTQAFFAQHTWRPGTAWSLMLGIRGDRDEVGYDERFPTVGNDDRRRFSEVSLRAGASWNPGERLGFYASYGEAYLPPTVEQMFSFPQFGSNRDLEPEDSATYEAGLRLRGAGGPDLDVALFVIDNENEIVFDPDSPLGSFGANVNAGRTRRAGVEASVRGEAAEGFDYYATLTLTDAEFRNGADAGQTVPLVPGQQLSAGIAVDLTPQVSFAADVLYVGEQVLDNDAARSRPRLDDYAVFDARVSWKPSRGPASGLELFVEGRNLLDEDYATRGIFAFDFSTFVNDTFLTPAPGRNYLAGGRYTF